MKVCTSCHINVGGYYKCCPLCQNGLEEGKDMDRGDEYPYFPSQHEIKVLSLFHKIQMFVMVSLCILFLALDYMFRLNNGIHWSFIVTVWAVSVEVFVSPLFRRRYAPLYLVTDIGVVLVAASFLTVKYVGGMFILTEYMIPIVIMVIILFDFIYCLVDKKGNALVFAICSVGAGIIPAVVMLVLYRDAPVMWEVCLIVSLITLAGLIAFKGSKVLNEMQKRLNI